MEGLSAGIQDARNYEILLEGSVLGVAFENGYCLWIYGKGYESLNSIIHEQWKFEAEETVIN